MKRSSFVKISGLSTLGLLIGYGLFASDKKGTPSVLIDIHPAKVHLRHGLFNLQSEDGSLDRFYIQRDIFPQAGLAEITENRVTSIKISENGSESFGVLQKEMIKSESPKLFALRISKNRSTIINTESPCLIFSEYNDFRINEIAINKNQALIQQTNTELRINSESEQTILIYQI